MKQHHRSFEIRIKTKIPGALPAETPEPCWEIGRPHESLPLEDGIIFLQSLSLMKAKPALEANSCHLAN